MTLDRTIPHLDEELEELSRKEAYKTVKQGLPQDKGLQLRCFESGHGEWWEYYRENPTEDGLLYSKDGLSVEQRPNRGDLLSTIGRDVFMGDDYVKDFWLVPMDRMPQWGDGSAHYSCHVCRSPVIATERTYVTGKGAAHDVCVED